MLEVVGINFKNGGRVYYFDPNGFKLREGITVIVETEQGTQFGKVVESNKEISKSIIKGELRKVIRVSTKADYFNHIKNLKDAKIALAKSRELVQKYELNMQIIEAVYTFDREQLMFRFISDGRVDFRDLVKELANIYKTRIELRQVGVRDRAKEISGRGICGQKLCCSRFLDELDTVSINMAKNQNLSLNPSKINGVCGRLLCCLKYEDDVYTDCKFGLPIIGSTADTDQGKGKVISVNILKRSYKVDVPEKGIIEVVKDEKN